MLKKTIFVFIVLAIFTNFNLVLAEEVSTSTSSLKSNIETPTIYPGTFSYQIKRLLEKISGRLLFFNDSKLNYEKKLLGARFSELQYISASKELDDVQHTSERFAYQAGIVADLVQTASPQEKEKVIKLFSVYRDDLDKIKFYFEMDSGYWILILHDINTLDLLTARLK